MIEQFNTFVWWQGRVEDRDDPLEIGRCRVRILGFHSQDKGDIPVDGLPWAYPAMPINSRPGDPPVGPVVGTWVMGFFRDGNDAQEPVMTHIIDSGYKTEDDSAPPESAPSWGGKREILTDEINTNRLARGETADTYVSDYTAGETFDGTSTSGEVIPISLTVPDLGYDAKYPHNKVEESQAGHVTEVDDTPGSERLSKVHSSGTFEVIKGDGARVVKIIGEDFEMVLSSKTLKVSGNLNIVSDGDINFKAGGTIRFETGETGQFRVKTGVATQFESPIFQFGGMDMTVPSVFGVWGGIAHMGGPFTLPLPAAIIIPDLPIVEPVIPSKPKTIKLGE
tara:strand:- start:30203 stop:31213 length:1011 start_codon:yes stop_codon:yes gene_type:complete